jgi:hypothetical protein
VSGVEALELESPEVELEFLAPELEGAVSDSMILGWVPGILPLRGYYQPLGRRCRCSRMSPGSSIPIVLPSS